MCFVWIGDRTASDFVLLGYLCEDRPGDETQHRTCRAGGMSAGSWYPPKSRRAYASLPPLGSLVALDHRVWRVRSAEPLPSGEWAEKDREQWERIGSPEQWPDRPVRLAVTNALSGVLVRNWVLRPWQWTGGRFAWTLVDEHFAVCSSCGEPWPCRHLEGASVAKADAERTARFAAVPTGGCYACGGAVTQRQRFVSFDGPNLLVEGGQEPVRFHLRSQCFSGALAYEAKWVAAHPWRRSRLTCAGWGSVHADGTLDCSLGEECVGPGSHHNSLAACYVGGRCQRGCDPTRHHGVGGRGANMALLWERLQGSGVGADALAARSEHAPQPLAHRTS